MNKAEMFVANEVKQYDMPEITQAIQLIRKYKKTKTYESKQLILDDWDINDKELYELVISIFTVILYNEELTFQAAVGLLNQKIKLSDELSQIKIIADVIGIVINTGLIDIDSVIGDYHVLSTQYAITDIPETDKHAVILFRPQPIEDNMKVFNGHAMNKHDGYFRLAHLNRMTQISFKLDQEFISEYEECSNAELDTEQKETQWELFRDKSTEKYQEVNSKEFYIKHNYDSRGRCYSENYYLNPQGISYKKAIIQLTKTELVEDV